MKAVLIIFGVLLVTTTFASENNPRSCTPAELTGYLNKADYISITTANGILHVEGEAARNLYIPLDSKEEPSNPKEVLTKVGSGYTCFKQQLQQVECAMYQCQIPISDLTSGRIGF